MSDYVLGFDEIDRKMTATVGGKGANLAELYRLMGVDVPAGFCVTTEAYQRMLLTAPEVRRQIEGPGALGSVAAGGTLRAGDTLRATILATPIPDEVQEAILFALSSFGSASASASTSASTSASASATAPVQAWAVRSSATSEDLPGASFAGQQDSFLNVVGGPAVLEHVRRCWASLFTDRAIAYRAQNGFDHSRVQMAVVLQKMIQPEASGVLFTADPVTGNRSVSVMEAVFGLGDALVSGLTGADRHHVRDGAILTSELERPGRPVLSEPQVVRLEALGRRIEAHFGCPQDIEWCLRGDQIHIVQSRPITTLFPIPETTVEGNRVYVSVGHQQMMTDPMRPLGLSFWQMTAARSMHPAAGRLFVDVTGALCTPAGKDAMLNLMGQSDPLIRDALTTVVEREGFLPPAEATAAAGAAGLPSLLSTPLAQDPSLVESLVARTEEALARLRAEIQEHTGEALFDFIRQDIEQRKQSLFAPESLGAVMAGIDASNWLNQKMEEWLGENSVANSLSQSVPNNVTSRMGLELLDVADVLRPYNKVIDYLRRREGRVDDEDFLDGLQGIEGGREVARAIAAFLEKYGMRCSGEIDISRDRWSEKPSTLLPLILSNLQSFPPGESGRRFERGKAEAERTATSLLERLRSLSDGESKAAETEEKIRLLRGFIGYREYPKYSLVSRYFVYKQALLREVAGLVSSGILRHQSEASFLTFDELRDAVRTQAVDLALIARREAEHEMFRRLSPPRVITSEGEAVTGTYSQRQLPEGALPGLAVSSGVAEGRARVMLEMGQARIEPGDILVTPFTDPGWTPLFVSVAALVTEVGGMMTHGAVIAREYGLPAVIGVQGATRIIADGQRIRVNGSEGYVEILE